MTLYTKHLKSDILAGLVVFLVALPLCLGIALASGAPLFAGIISGVIGGIVVGYLSSSQVSVAGPAAGLTAIVFAAITTLGSYEAFLLAVVIAGAIQAALGIAKAGAIANYIPTNVIEGMLAAIGVIIIMKQIPHAMGYDADVEGDFSFIENTAGNNTISSVIESIKHIDQGAIIISVVSIAILIAWTKIDFLKRLKVVPAALIVVIVGIALNIWFAASNTSLALGQSHLVSLPIPGSMSDFINQFKAPDFNAISNPSVWIVALTIAVVASVETLLCIEAADKMDPFKRYASTSRELKAQGIGNILSGLIGGLPMTSVIVRTSANVNSGGRTKVAAISHGVFLLLAIILIPSALNMIPLASLAAILIMIGFKLASPQIFKHMWAGGKYQFIPFVVTVVAVVFTDLLKGVGIGLVVSLLFILRANMNVAYFFKKEQHHEGETIYIDLAQEVSFLNKAAIKLTLAHLPENSTVVINASNSVYIDYDVIELLRDFLTVGAREKNITISTIGFKQEYKLDVMAQVSSH